MSLIYETTWHYIPHYLFVLYESTDIAWVVMCSATDLYAYRLHSLFAFRSLRVNLKTSEFTMANHILAQFVRN